MKKTIRITEAEWEVMAVTWEQAPVAASMIVEALEHRKQWTSATVRTLLRRLVNKGALRQEADGKRYLYTPLITVAEWACQESESFLDRVLGRVPSEAILHLVIRADLSEKDIQKLRRIFKEKENNLRIPQYSLTTVYSLASSSVSSPKNT
jgi:predicted transcriptional regulator